MFDDRQFGGLELHVKRPVIFIACAAGAMLLSLGLCGAAAGFPASTRLSYLAVGGFYLFAISLLTIIAGTVWLSVAMIINALRR